MQTMYTCSFVTCSLFEHNKCPVEYIHCLVKVGIKLTVLYVAGSRMNDWRELASNISSVSTPIQVGILDYHTYMC